MLYYLNTFLIYSFIGFLGEAALKTFVFHNMNSGVLHGPWVPIYGFGAMIIVFLTRYVFHHFKTRRWLKIVVTLIVVTITVTLFEYLGGTAIEAVTGKVFWNYDSMKFNFGHYICLEVTTVWAVISLVFTYLVKPYMDKVIKKIPVALTAIVFLFFMIDVVFTVLKLF